MKDLILIAMENLEILQKKKIATRRLRVKRPRERETK